MIDTTQPPQVQHKVFQLGVIVDGDQILLGIPEDQITCQADIDMHVKKAQAWLRDLYEKAQGFEDRMKAIGALMRPGQSSEPVPTEDRKDGIVPPPEGEAT